jgi:hypothetical protein
MRQGCRGSKYKIVIGAIRKSAVEKNPNFRGDFDSNRDRESVRIQQLACRR